MSERKTGTPRTNIHYQLTINALLININAFYHVDWSLYFSTRTLIQATLNSDRHLPQPFVMLGIINML